MVNNAIRLLKSPLGIGIFLLFLFGYNYYLRSVTFSFSTIDWDEITYLIMGKGILDGKIPYLEIYDNKPIGSFLVYVVMIPIFGYTIECIRWTSLLFTILGSWGMILLLWRYSRAWAYFSGFAYSSFFVALPSGFSGNTELFFLPLEILGFYGIFRGRNASVFWGSLLVGCAFMIKYIIAFDVLLVFGLSFLFFLRKANNHSLSRVSIRILSYIGFILPILASFLYFASLGSEAMDSYIESILISGGQYSQTTSLRHKIQSFQPLVYVIGPALALTTALWTLSPFRSKVLRIKPFYLALVWLVATGIGATWTGYFFEHYLLTTIPPLLFIIGLVLRTAKFSFGNRSLREKLGNLSIPDFFIIRMNNVTFLVLVLAAFFPAQKVRSQYSDLLQKLPDTPRLIANDMLLHTDTSLFVAKGIHSAYVLTHQMPPVRVVQPSNYTEILYSQKMNIRALDVIAQVQSQNPNFIQWCDQDLLVTDPEDFEKNMDKEYLKVIQDFVRKSYGIYGEYYPDCKLYKRISDEKD